MADWEKLEDYLRQANYHYEHEIQDTSRIQEVDESVTRSLEYLREMGLDTGDPEVMYAFILGIATSYRHGRVTVQHKCGNPLCASAFLRHHNQSHGDLALVTRTLARNLGIDLPRYEDEGE